MIGYFILFVFQDGDYSQSSGDYRGHNLHHPPYVGYPVSKSLYCQVDNFNKRLFCSCKFKLQFYELNYSLQSSQGYPSRDSPSMHETAYTEIDHRSYTPGNYYALTLFFINCDCCMISAIKHRSLRGFTVVPPLGHVG